MNFREIPTRHADAAASLTQISEIMVENRNIRYFEKLSKVRPKLSNLLETNRCLKKRSKPTYEIIGRIFQKKTFGKIWSFTIS